MSDKQPNQAMPSGGDTKAKDGVWNSPGKGGGGESGGGSYESPRNEPGGDNGGYMGHGGQTDIGYSGTGQGGSDDDDVGNANAPTKEG